MAEPQVRKVVTVLFSDVTGSTALGEQLDPETTRAVMGRWFATMRRVIERHGGTVEKFIGDAVVAVFGIPTLHGDDALRAVRAAGEMRAALAALNRELEADLGVVIEMRTGINTGEVVAGDPTSGETFVTGDAVNVAARLEQAARPGDTLLGEGTYRLVRNEITVGIAEAIEAKGKSAAIRAYRLVDATPQPADGDRPLDTPFIGRRRELRRLAQAFDDAVEERRCELMTVVGQAGVGKSRLLAEFLGGLGDGARIIRGRCLPYGEGITWWPLAEALRGVAGIGEADGQDVARDKLRALVRGTDATIVADRLASSIGLSSESASQAEIFWAIRRLLEELAADRPVVAVFEDLHWAEPTFLDAIEHVATISRGAPILLLCPARPELIESRPGWGGGNQRATTLLLGPLPLEDAERLIGAIPAGSALPAALSGRIADVADGNPLFVQEMVGMLVDEGILEPDGDGWVVDEDRARGVAVPPNIQALLAARLDQLLAEERTVAGRASVVGRVFEEAAVVELAPAPLRQGVPAALVALVRKELIVPDRAQLTVGDAFKFRHVLIRDAAYASLPKADRADLHEAFGGWLERVAGDRAVEYEEILGYHFEQAHDYRRDLGLRDERTASLARRAGRWLARAGQRARAREDAAASKNLLVRATAILTADDEEYLHARLTLADAMLYMAEYAPAKEILETVVAEATDSKPELAAEARILRLWATQSLMLLPDARRELAEVLCLLRHGLTRSPLRSDVWRIAGEAIQDMGDVRAAERAYRRALRHAERAGSDRAQSEVLLSLAALGARSEMPVAEAERLTLDAMALTGSAPSQRAWAKVNLAYLAALQGRFDEARRLLEETVAVRRELGIVSANSGITSGIVELLAGDLDAAERHFRFVIAAFERDGVTSELPFLAGRLGQVLALQGKDDEALALAEFALERGKDPYSGTFAGGTRARVLARRGRLGEALAAARAVVARAREDGLEQLPQLYGSALEDLAAVLVLAGEEVEAASTLADAIERYERKGSVAAAVRARERFEAIGRAASSSIGEGAGRAAP